MTRDPCDIDYSMGGDIDLFIKSRTRFSRTMRTLPHDDVHRKGDTHYRHHHQQQPKSSTPTVSTLLPERGIKSAPTSPLEKDIQFSFTLGSRGNAANPTAKNELYLPRPSSKSHPSTHKAQYVVNQTRSNISERTPPPQHWDSLESSGSSSLGDDERYKSLTGDEIDEPDGDLFQDLQGGRIHTTAEVTKILEVVKSRRTASSLVDLSGRDDDWDRQMEKEEEIRRILREAKAMKSKKSPARDSFIDSSIISKYEPAREKESVQNYAATLWANISSVVPSIATKTISNTNNKFEQRPSENNSQNGASSAELKFTYSPVSSFSTTDLGKNAGMNPTATVDRVQQAFQSGTETAEMVRRDDGTISSSLEAICSEKENSLDTRGVKPNPGPSSLQEQQNRWSAFPIEERGEASLSSNHKQDEVEVIVDQKEDVSASSTISSKPSSDLEEINAMGVAQNVNCDFAVDNLSVKSSSEISSLKWDGSGDHGDEGRHKLPPTSETNEPFIPSDFAQKIPNTPSIDLDAEASVVSNDKSVESNDKSVKEVQAVGHGLASEPSREEASGDHGDEGRHKLPPTSETNEPFIPSDFAQKIPDTPSIDLDAEASVVSNDKSVESNDKSVKEVQAVGHGLASEPSREEAGELNEGVEENRNLLSGILEFLWGDQIEEDDESFISGEDGVASAGPESLDSWSSEERADQEIVGDRLRDETREILPKVGSMKEDNRDPCPLETVNEDDIPKDNFPDEALFDEAFSEESEELMSQTLNESQSHVSDISIVEYSLNVAQGTVTVNDINTSGPVENPPSNKCLLCSGPQQSMTELRKEHTTQDTLFKRVNARPKMPRLGLNVKESVLCVEERIGVSHDDPYLSSQDTFDEKKASGKSRSLGHLDSDDVDEAIQSIKDRITLRIGLRADRIVQTGAFSDLAGTFRPSQYTLESPEFDKYVEDVDRALEGVKSRAMKNKALVQRTISTDPTHPQPVNDLGSSCNQFVSIPVDTTPQKVFPSNKFTWKHELKMLQQVITEDLLCMGSAPPEDGLDEVNSFASIEWNDSIGVFHNLRKIDGKSKVASSGIAKLDAAKLVWRTNGMSRNEKTTACRVAFHSLDSQEYPKVNSSTKAMIDLKAEVDHFKELLVEAVRKKKTGTKMESSMVERPDDEERDTDLQAFSVPLDRSYPLAPGMPEYYSVGKAADEKCKESVGSDDVLAIKKQLSLLLERCESVPDSATDMWSSIPIPYLDAVPIEDEL
jgi:hypothetical protein